VPLLMRQNPTPTFAPNMGKPGLEPNSPNERITVYGRPILGQQHFSSHMTGPLGH
jgi:hypothetical protein